MRKSNHVAAIAREFTPSRQTGVRNPFRTLQNVRREEWRKFSDFTGRIGTTRGIVRS